MLEYICWTRASKKSAIMRYKPMYFSPCFLHSPENGYVVSKGLFGVFGALRVCLLVPNCIYFGLKAVSIYYLGTWTRRVLLH